MTPIELLHQIKFALREAFYDDYMINERLALASVKLELKVLVEKSAGINFKIPVIGIGLDGGASESSLHTLRISLKPPSGRDVLAQLTPSVQDELVSGLKRVRELVAAFRSDLVEPELDVVSSEFVLEFTVTAQGKIELVGTAGAKSSQIHNIGITLEAI